MISAAGIVLLAASVAVSQAQAPPPNTATRQSQALRAQYTGFLRAESERLVKLADRLKADANPAAEAEVRALLPEPPAPDGSERFEPLPPLVLAKVAPKKEPWRTELDGVRAEAAKALFELAGKAAAASPRRLALADLCLRGVLERSPDHAEARRLLGYIPHQGGWATPFAARETQAGKVLHPVFGWVFKSWIPRLANGELPVRGGAIEGRETWGTTEAADAAHREWSSAWSITTEHFQVLTNVPLAEAIAFGRQLETLHDLFQSRFADVIGESLPLAQRYKNPKLEAVKPGMSHRVSYFADRAGYAEAVRVYPDADTERSLGYYNRPQSRTRPGRAFFFREPGGEIDATATLFHEASHQLLFESGVAGPNDWTKNDGNFWVFEGLGTYFETLTPRKDGSLRIGGLAGVRNAAARESFRSDARLVPLPTFVALNQSRFGSGDNVYLNYQQASALTSLLMDGSNGAFRDGFLAYVKAVCQGRVRRTSGRSLEDHVETPYKALESGLKTYLESGSVR